MTDQPKPKPDQKTDEALIVTPISIARARHASTQAASDTDKTRRVSAATRHKQSSQSASVRASSYHSDSNGWYIGGMSGCLLISLLSAAFLIGGVLGGMMGGGVILWANDSQAALWSGVPTSIPMPSPSPAPAATLTPTPTSEPIPTPSVEDVIARIIPSVVTIVNQQQNDFALRPDEGRVVGSGVVVDERGYIVTNHHVIENSVELHVTLADGREAVAELVASDRSEDLAILKIEASDLPAIPWGDSTTLRLGQTVYAIGSPLGDFPNSVSLGIISGLNRALEMEDYVIDGLIQTDAAINRGSSGGPLINAKGEMMGINTFIIRESEDRGVAEGIAFAIPAHTAKHLLISWIAAHSGDSVPIPASDETGN